jgi:catechol 2,3-dioxygenase-like lactoylglutathione lyase family enzyme
MKIAVCMLAAATAALSGALAAAPVRPAITGVSHIAVYAAAPAKSEHFYVHDLGAVKGVDPENPTGVRYYFSSAQFVEVLPLPVTDRSARESTAASGPPSINRLDHVAFTTADARALRAYLSASKVVVPGPIQKGSDGSQWLDVTDPEGNKIEFVQPPAGSPPLVAGQLPTPGQPPAAGQLPAPVILPNALSTHIIHVGFIVHDRAREDAFFRTVLGFRPYWFGGMDDNHTAWISQQVPDGTDWLEYMIVGTPDGRGIPADMTAQVLGILNHFSLGVPSAEGAYTLLWNGGRLAGQIELPKIGRDAKWQLNLFDPDGTRAEIMEFHAIGTPCCSPFTASDPQQ